jgi:hypothetical protein
MAHYAFLDENNVVTEVITGRHEWEVVGGVSDWEKYYGDFRGQKCLRTSYNGNIRKRFAGIGHVYLEDEDIFVREKPYQSWVLDEDFEWQAPVPKPDITELELLVWDEDNGSWIIQGLA